MRVLPPAWRLIGLWLGLTSAGSGWAASAPEEPERWVITLSERYAPAVQDYLMQVTTEVFARAGIQVTFASLPLRRAIAHAQSGVADGTLATTLELLEDSTSLVSTKDAIGIVSLAVLIPDDSTITSEWSALSDRRVGYQLGDELTPQRLRNLPLQGEAVEVSTAESLAGMVAAGRLDAVIAECALLTELAAERPGLKVLSPPIELNLVFPVLHVRHRDRMADIDRVIRTMKQEGQIWGFTQRLPALCGYELLRPDAD